MFIKSFLNDPHPPRGSVHTRLSESHEGQNINKSHYSVYVVLCVAIWWISTLYDSDLQYFPRVCLELYWWTIESYIGRLYLKSNFDLSNYFETFPHNYLWLSLFSGYTNRNYWQHLPCSDPLWFSNHTGDCFYKSMDSLKNELSAYFAYTQNPFHTLLPVLKSRTWSEYWML